MGGLLVVGVGVGVVFVVGGGVCVCVCVCVMGGGRMGGVLGGAPRGWSSHVFCLASPETMSQPGRFVPEGG